MSRTESTGSTSDFEIDGPPAPLLEVDDLRVHFKTDRGVVKAVDGVSWHVTEGETLAIVGESGSGKSVSAMSILGLVPTPPATFPSGDIRLRGRSVLKMPEKQQRKLRGQEISMIFQDPLTALNPVFKIGDQIMEMIRNHQQVTKTVARRKVLELLGEVGIPNPAVRINQYPHEFSGGMRQRAMIGMGLMGEPRLIVADEPTTALDVTVQRQVLRLLAEVRAERAAAILLISHDITVVAQTCDRILVMYAGRFVEDLPAAELYTGARHPYTRALLAAVPDLDTDRDRPLAVIPGRPPEPERVPPGCAFAPRCPRAGERCTREDPEPVELAGGHRVACWHPVQPAAESEPVKQSTSGGAA